MGYALKYLKIDKSLNISKIGSRLFNVLKTALIIIFPEARRKSISVWKMSTCHAHLERGKYQISPFVQYLSLHCYSKWSEKSILGFVFTFSVRWSSCQKQKSWHTHFSHAISQILDNLLITYCPFLQANTLFWSKITKGIVSRGYFWYKEVTYGDNQDKPA